MPTKPKKEKGYRITSPGKKLPNQKGRPKGTRLKRKFEETRLGFMLKYETPLEYEIIIRTAPGGVFVKPDADLIQAICSASDDDSFKKPKFKRYLDEYREHGIHCDRPKTLNENRKTYYEKIRLNKIRKYTIGKKIELRKMI